MGDDCTPCKLLNDGGWRVGFEPAVKRIFKYIQSTDCIESIRKSIVGGGK